MKYTAKQLKEAVATALRVAILEAKKKGKKKKSSSDEDEIDEPFSVPPGYLGSKKHDFSKPLGKKNIVRAAGGSSFGPNTTGESVARDKKLTLENHVRGIVRKAIKEEFNRLRKMSRR